MAIVFLAEDLRHHRPIALKTLRPELAEGIGTERFLHEIEIAAALTHPHILPLYDSGEAAGVVYYVMPFVEGPSLRDRLEAEGRLPIAEALQIARQVVGALDYAHRRGLVHRDIKPENIMLYEGAALVTDFGIALALRSGRGGDLVEAGLVVGTPVYMSPDAAELQAMLDVQAGWLGMRPPEQVEIDAPAKDGDKLVVGATEFHVLHTPGHTQGSISLWIPSERKLIAGDTLFRDSIGRTDLPGGDGRQILQSIHDKLLPLPDDTVVIPGHGDNTTIGHEKQFNYFLQRM